MRAHVWIYTAGARVCSNSCMSTRVCVCVCVCVRARAKHSQENGPASPAEAAMRKVGPAAQAPYFSPLEVVRADDRHRIVPRVHLRTKPRGAGLCVLSAPAPFARAWPMMMCMGAALASSAASPSAWPSCVMSKRNASSNFGSTEPAAVAIQHAMAAAMQHARIQTDA